MSLARALRSSSQITYTASSVAAIATSSEDEAPGGSPTSRRTSLGSQVVPRPVERFA
jgi:hypothetical protein